MTPELTKDFVFWSTFMKGIIRVCHLRFLFSLFFCIQMHSIFYITYFNKLYLQRVFSCITFWNWELFVGIKTICQRILFLIWQENFIQMHFLPALWNHYALTHSLSFRGWMPAQKQKTKMCVRENIHVFLQEREGCMVCCFNPDGLRLPVSWFCQSMMICNDKPTCTFASFLFIYRWASMLLRGFSSPQLQLKGGC